MDKLKLFDIPGLDGWKTLIGGYGLLIIGVGLTITKVATLVVLVGQCLSGDAALGDCYEQIPVLLTGLLSSFGGISALGIGHKVEWAIRLLEKKE